MIHERKFNFSPGPAQLPEEVLLEVQEDLLNWKGCGSSVMELSHRGKEFNSIAESAEQDLRELLSLSSDFEVLFLQGGASSQFALIPLNFLHDKQADYVISGRWSQKAHQEATRVGKINIASDSVDNNYTSIKEPDSWSYSDDPAYLHYTSNETVGGVQFKYVPDKRPLVCDMSSDLLTREIDLTDFALVYAGVQKNLGPAGLTLVIIDKDFLNTANQDLPSIHNYRALAKAKSLYNTPPCFAWYVTGLVLKWIKKQGLRNIQTQNEEKARLLYDLIDTSSFYNNPINPDCRSTMNIPFTLVDDSLDQTFVKQAEENNLINLKGHRSIGGMRASIYNAMPLEGVQALIDFMKEFESKNG